MATRAPFPDKVADFQDDDRISYSKVDDKYVLEEDNGDEWEFNEAVEKWVPLVDEELIRQQQAAYIIAGVDENEPVQVGGKKRKQEGADGAKEAKRKKKEDKPKADKKNTGVYVTSLPADVTVEEIHEVFSKYGIIAEEVDSNKPRIKIYTNDDGKPKGDALVLYFRPESVQLAINMLDDSDFRYGVQGVNGRMRVKEADRSYKKTKDAAPATGMNKDRKKVIKKTQKLNDKLADWSDDEAPAAKPPSKHDSIVIFKQMFTLEELREDPDTLDEIKNDTADECAKIGEVLNVTLFDKEKDGVITVRFADPEDANRCVRAFTGRKFGGQTIEVYISDGTEKFKKSANKKLSDEEEQKRLEDFGDFLEGDEEKAKPEVKA